MAEEPSVKRPAPVETIDPAVVESLAPPSDAQQQQQQQVPVKTSRRHRRVASEDVTQSYNTGGGAGYYQYPPTQISYNVSNVSPKNGGGAPLFPPSGSNRTRSGSWSGMPPPPMQQGYPPQQYQHQHPHQHQHQQPQYPASPGYPNMPPPQMMSYSPAGNPVAPFIIDPNQDAGGGGGMLPPHTGQYDNPRRKRKNAGHRRVHSYSGDATGSGSMSMFDQPPPPPSGAPPLIPARRESPEFSPRSEILKLAGFRNTGPPSPRKGPSPPQSMRNINSPRQSSFRPPGAFTKPDDGRGVSFSPGTPIQNGTQSARGNLGVYGMDSGAVAAMQAPFIASSSRSGDGIGGEAVFLAQKKSKHRKSPSGRKMHMRQQSAQLFMEEVKGVEQQPKCRDVAFLLFFLFHILGIVYLGNTYGFEALRFHDELESETSVTIIYRNVVYVACLSGIFAVTISALALLLMTAIAKKLVQAALMLTITLSFFWGTIGIGLSPKKVVPATGIIALALSIAYTFIVWDRIPFAAANLNAALNGIRANPGAVLVAFFFQFLSLAWSIYYTYVVVGVYDAVEVGEWDLTHPWKIALFCGLGISYYWTYHVFLVSDGILVYWSRKHINKLQHSNSPICSVPFQIMT
jgi:nitrate reductase NapE component